MKVYTTLREEIIDDQLLKGQPGAAQDWLREVIREPRGGDRRAAAARGGFWGEPEL